MALIVHLLSLFLLYITNLHVLARCQARHRRTSTLAANFERRAYILHGDLWPHNILVHQHMST